MHPKTAQDRHAQNKMWPHWTLDSPHCTSRPSAAPQPTSFLPPTSRTHRTPPIGVRSAAAWGSWDPRARARIVFLTRCRTDSGDCRAGWRCCCGVSWSAMSWLARCTRLMKASLPKWIWLTACFHGAVIGRRSQRKRCPQPPSEAV